jgi:SAM-dependent methyltransferase
MNPAEYGRMFEAEDSHWWYVGLHELVLGRVARESERLGRRLRIFDAGCGTGRLCQLMSRYGEVAGVDVSAEAIRYCHKRNVAAKLGDLNELELEPGSYDIITSIDVIYHTGIRDDVRVLQKLRAALKPGGMLILNLVAFEFLRSTHDVAVHTRERYRRDTLKERLAAAGFQVGFVTYRVSLLFPLIAAYRLLSRLLRKDTQAHQVLSDVKLPQPLVNAAFLRLLRMENVLLQRWALPVGISVFAVARQPQRPDLESI